MTPEELRNIGKQLSEGHLLRRAEARLRNRWRLREEVLILIALVLLCALVMVRLLR
jgi:hypothetical protein